MPYIRTFNIFKVYQYFTFYRWYFLLKSIFINILYSLKSGGTKDNFRSGKSTWYCLLLKGL